MTGSWEQNCQWKFISNMYKFPVKSSYAKMILFSGDGKKTPHGGKDQTSQTKKTPNTSVRMSLNGTLVDQYKVTKLNTCTPPGYRPFP